MNANPNILELRKQLFAQLEALNDHSKPADIPRARAAAEVAQVLVNSLKVEVDFHAVMKGAIDLPFIENQTPLLSADTPPDQKALTAMERATLVLTGGNAAHPWRNRSARFQSQRASPTATRPDAGHE